MRNSIPRRPVQLATFLGDLITGDEKHQQDKPLSTETRAAIVATKSQLDSLNGTVQTSKGQLRSSTQARRAFMQTALIDAERFRAAVLALYGPKDAALVDYALATRRKAHKAGNGQTGSVTLAQRTAKRLSHAQDRVNRKQVKLDQLLTSLAKAKAVLVLREAEAAHVQPAAPTESSTPHSPQGDGGSPTSEPTPASVPTSESGTK